MKQSLTMQAAVKFLAGAALVALLLFLPAGTLAWRGAWLFLVLLFVPIAVVGVVLLRKNPELLEKRLNGKEKAAQQRGVVGLSGLMFLAGFVLAGLDARFGWTCVPLWLTVAAAVLFLMAYVLYAEVLRENAYLSRTIEVQKGQMVVDTGLYGVVRHPMYAATVLLFLAMPLVLGSWVSFAVFLVYPALMVVRIRHEEALLTKELAGYDAYIQKVRWRMIPFIW